MMPQSARKIYLFGSKFPATYEGTSYVYTVPLEPNSLAIPFAPSIKILLYSFVTSRITSMVVFNPSAISELVGAISTGSIGMIKKSGAMAEVSFGIKA